MARKRILLCGHPNPLGCPNHGDLAREVWAEWCDVGHEGSFFVALVVADAHAPIPFVMTGAGHEALRAAGIRRLNPPA